MIKELQEIEMPARIARLPRTANGYPIPYFVAYINGKPDMKILDAHKQLTCIQYRRCGICGESIGGEVAFISGPIGIANCVVTDPGMHEECAEYAIRVCPFMARPNAKRAADFTYPEGSAKSPGALEERPDRTGIAISRAYAGRNAGDGSVLIKFYPPSRVRWFVDGAEVP